MPPMIAGNHHDSDACRVALLDGGGDGGTYRVGQTHEAQELEGEVMLLARQFLLPEHPLATPSTRSPSWAIPATLLANGFRPFGA